MSNFPSRSPHALRSLFVACAMLGLAASAQAATTLETVQQNSSIRIGYANETPFAFTEIDGRVTGESPEIAKAIFAKMGIKQVNGVLTEWGSLIPGLRAVNAGALEMARIVEQLTPMLISVNTRYKVHAGIRLTGLPDADHWA